MTKILIIATFIIGFIVLVYIFKSQLYNLFSKFKKNKVIQAKPTNYTKPTIEKYQSQSTQISVILCYANWCSHCPLVKEWYDGLVDSSPRPNIQFTKFEESDIPPQIFNLINGFPTILIIANGQNVIYPGERSREALLSYLDNI